jgi:hypothetical protein
VGEVDELVGLPAQLVGHHRGLRGDRRDHRDAHAPALHRLDEGAEIAVAGEQHHVVDVGGELERIDGELDIHVALDLAAAGRIHEFLRGFRNDAVAVVVEPVDERADRGVFLILDQSSIVERPDEVAPALELLQQALVVDIEAERLRRRVKVRPIDEERNFLLTTHVFSRVGRPKELI